MIKIFLLKLNILNKNRYLYKKYTKLILLELSF